MEEKGLSEYFTKSEFIKFEKEQTLERLLQLTSSESKDSNDSESEGLIELKISFNEFKFYQQLEQLFKVGTLIEPYVKEGVVRGVKFI